MKKIISLFIAVILCVGLLVPTVSASSNAEIVMGTTSGKTGDTVAVDLTLKSNPGFGTLGVTVSYDKTKLELVSVTDKKVFTNGDTKAPYKNTGTDSSIGIVPYLIVWQDNFTLKNTTETGKLATFHFKIIGTASEQSKIVIAVKNCFQADMNLTNVATTVTDGSVKISGSGAAVSSSVTPSSSTSSENGSDISSSLSSAQSTSSQPASNNSSEDKKVPSSFVWQIVIMSVVLVAIIILSVVYMMKRKKK